MEPQYNTIHKKDNKLIYAIDSALDKFVALLIIVARLFVPSKYKKKFDTLTEHKEMLHNVIGLTFFNALGGFCVMATQVKLANYLGASVYGVYSYCLAIGEVGAMFVRYGRNKTMVRDLIQMPEKRDDLIVSTFFLSLINLALFMAVTFAFHNQLDIECNWAYFLLIISPCLISVDPGPVYESLKLMSWHSIYALIQKFGFLIVIWLLFALHVNVGLFSIGAIVTVSWIVVLLMQFKEISEQLNINFLQNVKISELWKLYKDNFSIFLSCVCGVAFGPLLRLILNNNVDSTAVGIYSAGLQIYHICLFFNTQVGRVGNPMMAVAGRSDVSTEKRRTLVIRYTIIMLLTALPFALPMLLCPHLIVDMLFTADYSSLSAYLPILAIYLVAISLGVVFTQFLISMRKDTIYFIIYVTSAIVTIVLAYILIPRYEVLGAMLALCIPHSIGCLFYLLYSLKYLRK